MTPHAEPRLGCILEFKVASASSDRALSTAAAAGLAQIISQDYARGLFARHCQLRQIWAYGLGCQGKCCAAVCECITPG